MILHRPPISVSLYGLLRDWRNTPRCYHLRGHVFASLFHNQQICASGIPFRWAWNRPQLSYNCQTNVFLSFLLMTLSPSLATYLVLEEDSWSALWYLLIQFSCSCLTLQVHVSHCSSLRASSVSDSYHVKSQELYQFSSRARHLYFHLEGGGYSLQSLSSRNFESLCVFYDRLFLRSFHLLLPPQNFLCQQEIVPHISNI